jgi:hypothetical protein
MLDNIRKYTGLMFVVLILLFVGLVFMESSASRRGYGSGPVIVEVDGRGYPAEEFDRVSTNPLRLLNDLSSQSFQARYTIAPYLYQLAAPLDGNPGQDFDPKQFLANRLILQKTARRIGIHPSVAEVEKLIRERVFVNQADQTFNAEAYNKYIDKSLPRLGMSIKDMNDTLREVLALERLQDILGSGLAASETTVKEDIADSQQEITYKLITFPASKYEADEMPTDEEVKTYWEENQGRYLSDAKRRVTYVIAQPDFDALLEEEKKKAAPAAAESPDTETPAGETPAETPSTITELTNAQRDAAIMAEGGRIDELWEALRQADGEDFEGKAAKAGFEVKTTELFTKEACPPEFSVATQGIRRSRAVDIIFDATLGTKPMDAISDAHRLGADQWLIFRLDEIIEAKQLDYEAAKDEARLDLVKERSRAKMAEAAEAARTALLEAVAGGKTFDEAAAAQELEVVSRDAVKRDTRPPGEPTPDEIFTLASKVNPGETSEILTQNDEARSVFRSLFVQVVKRELVETALEPSVVSQRLNSMSNAYRQIALQNWMSQEYHKAGVVIP